MEHDAPIPFGNNARSRMPDQVPCLHHRRHAGAVVETGLHGIDDALLTRLVPERAPEAQRTVAPANPFAYWRAAAPAYQRRVAWLVFFALGKRHPDRMKTMNKIAVAKRMAG
mgnify:CR=1 FL=1